MDKALRNHMRAERLRKRNARFEAEINLAERTRSAYRLGQQNAKIPIPMQSEFMSIVLSEAARRVGFEMVDKIGDKVPYSVLEKIAERYWEEIERTGAFENPAYMAYLFETHMDAHVFEFRIPEIRARQTFTGMDLRMMHVTPTS